MQTFTLAGNNILQNYIYENRYNKEAPFAIPPTPRFEKLMEAYRILSPDLIALQECDEGWHDLLDRADGLPSLGYAAVTDAVPSEPLRMIRNPLYYQTERFTVEAAGYGIYEGTKHGALANPWCYSWGVLCEKGTGKRFLAASTHLIWVSIDNFAQRDAFAKQLTRELTALAETYGVPVVAAGDYNAHTEEPAYRTMSSFFTSARDCDCARAHMEFQTCTHFGKPPEVAEDVHGIVDHTFFSKTGITPVRYEVLVEPTYYCYSDHVPQVFTFAVENA